MLMFADRGDAGRRPAKRLNVALSPNELEQSEVLMTWTKERRARQAELIRTWKPWKRSTGPRTPAGKARIVLRNRTLRPWTRSTGPRTAEGKARASRNAFKGANRPWWRAVDTILKMYHWRPGARTVADCEPLTDRERAALETYDRLHPSRFRKIWINVRVDGVRTKGWFDPEELRAVTSWSELNDRTGANP